MSKGRIQVPVSITADFAVEGSEVAVRIRRGRQTVSFTMPAQIAVAWSTQLERCAKEARANELGARSPIAPRR